MKLFLVFCLFLIQVSCKQAASESQEQKAVVETISGANKTVLHLNLKGKILFVGKQTYDSNGISATSAIGVDWESAEEFLKSSEASNPNAIRFYKFDASKGGKNEIRTILLEDENRVVFYRRDLSNPGEVFWELAESLVTAKNTRNFFTNKKEKTYIFQTLGEYALRCGQISGTLNPKNKCNQKPMSIN